MVGAIYVGLVGWIMLGDDFNGNRIIPGIGWRLFALICAIPVVVALLLTTYIVPESPRYLVGKHRYTEAVSFLFASFPFFSFISINLSFFILGNYFIQYFKH